VGLVIVWRCIKIKSLYTRIVIIYISTIIFSLLAAYLGTNILYYDHSKDEMRKILLNNANKMIDIYHSTHADDLLAFLNAYSGTSGTKLQLYNSKGVPLLENEHFNVKEEYVQKVLSGVKTDNFNQFITHVPLVGIPFQEDGKEYAIFLTNEKNQFFEQLMSSVHLMYIVILFFGSLLIIIAARYVVHPLLKLTDATRKMAQGNFDIVLPTKRKDEIGTLSSSFNEMAKELKKLDLMRRDFVANVSHEIQSPLTSISGFSKALKQKNIDEEKRIHYLNIIEEESERLSRLSRNLLRLSHLQHDQLQLNMTRFRLDEQLRNVVISLEPQWSAKNLTLKIDLTMITIEADEDQLKQVWTNLINNGIKFTPPYGKITIHAIAKNNMITVSITDNGIGISPEERNDIFKPFHKTDKSRGSSIKGNGLGLAIVKQIVSLHKGDIEVSEGVQGGAKFIIKIPQ
jgi:signal transduction histidine kinase